MSRRPQPSPLHPRELLSSLRLVPSPVAVACAVAALLGRLLAL